MKKFIVLILLCSVFIALQKIGYDYTPANRTLAAIKVWNQLDIDFAELSSSMVENDIVKKYSAIKLDCGNEPSPMGDRSCYSHIRKVNEADAWFIAFFFDKGKLTQVKIDLSNEGHARLLKDLEQQLNKPSGETKDQNGVPIAYWMLSNGVVSTNEKSYEKGTTQLLWIAKEKLLHRLLGKIPTDEARMER